MVQRRLAEGVTNNNKLHPTYLTEYNNSFDANFCNLKMIDELPITRYTYY